MTITKKQFFNFIKANWLIILIWLIGLFLRTYRQDQLLGFYYDQGRDAKTAQDIITGNNFPAIGPTTGIQGLHLGPIWFYLITPGYFFGQGNPVIASYFISFLESLTIPLIYFVVKKYWSINSAYLAAIIWTSSNYLIRSSRWFSNPSPLPFFVVLIIFFLLKIFKDKKPQYWPWVFFLLGITLQLEAASAFFFIPTIILLSLLNFSQIKKTKIKTWAFSFTAFCFLLLPQLAFEIKNKFLITKNFFSFIFGNVNTTTGKSWAIPTQMFIEKRIQDYYEYFFSKLDTNTTIISIIFLIIFLITIIHVLAKHRKNTFVQIILLWLFVPLVLLLFFVGNYGVLYDYYLTGFFPAFVIIFSLSISLIKKIKIQYILLFLILSLFLRGNAIYVKDYLIAGTDGSTHISLGNQKQSIEYICSQTANTKYNLEIYVPPIVPHSYEYLINWYSKNGKCTPPTTEKTETVYILYETDLQNPNYLSSWLQSIDSIAKIELANQFGGIYVQKRNRI